MKLISLNIDIPSIIVYVMAYERSQFISTHSRLACVYFMNRVDDSFGGSLSPREMLPNNGNGKAWQTSPRQTSFC